MKYEKLGEHVFQVRGISFKPENIITTKKDGYVPVIRSNNITEEGFKESDLIYINKEFIRSEQVIKGGDLVLTASSGSKKTIGKNIQFDSDFNGSFGAFCKLVRPKKSIDSKYLYHFFKTRFFRDSIERIVQGANIANLKNEYIDDLKILLPPLDDQIRIATLLSKVENLISRRREQIKQLDQLLKSVFLEIFCLKNGNVKKWIIEPLSACTEIVSGVTKGKKYNGNKLREVPYMRVANVKDGYLNLSEIKTIEVTEAEIHKYKLISGDLLLTEGGDPDKLGRGAVWSCEIDECIHQNHIFRVRAIGNSVNPVFLSALMASKYGKSYFFKAAKQTTGIASINSTQLKAFPLIKPPIDLQNRFAAIVNKVESVRAQYTESLTNIESFYGTLSQKAFKGDLDMSRVPIVEMRGKGDLNYFELM